MKDSIKNRKRKLLALCLSAMMLSSVAAIAACTDSDGTDSSSSSSSSSAATSEVKDDGLVKNAGFETYDEDNVLNTSTTGWTRNLSSATSGSAPSSKAASGILDLSDDGWKKLTGSYYDDPDTVKTLTEEQAEAVWDKLTVKDKLAYYAYWEENNDDKTISNELDFYEKLNITEKDIPDIARFDTHHKEGDEGYGEDTKVLMIHNEKPVATGTKYLGTAQNYTSSSTVTVKAGTAAKFSVWVRTQDLTCANSAGETQEAVGKGAFISVTHSVGGATLDAYTIENINTETMGDLSATNGWAHYEFYLNGSTYADTTFSLTLGLGQGGGTYYGEYVNGYAFFDDIQCEIISTTDYNAEVGTEITPVTFEMEGEDKIVDASLSANADKKVFAMDFHGDFVNADVLTGATVGVTKTEFNGTEVSASKNDNPASWLAGGKNPANDVAFVFDNAEALKNGTGVTGITAGQQTALTAVYTKYFEKDTAFATQKTLLLLSDDGVAYTAKSAMNFEFKDPDASSPTYGNETKYLAISFFVKTSDMHGGTGASVTLVDGNNETTFESIDTSDIEAVEVKGEKLYGDWQQYFFFVENDSDNAATTFSLQFNFGPKTIATSTTADNYHHGFAAFTNFQVRSMSQAEFESAQSGTYAKSVSVLGSKNEDESTEGDPFDSAKGTPSEALKEGFAAPQNYKGVYKDSVFVAGSGSAEINKNGNAGLLNRTYFVGDDENVSYYDKDTGWMATIGGGETNAETVWNTVIGKDATQPLFILNDGKAYGFIGNSTTIAANTYTAVSVRVKGTNGAAAYIRLIDTDKANYDNVPKAYNKTLSIGSKLTYWYDDEGNICTAAPSEKTSRVAFKLQPNGLYKANKSWSGYESLGDNKDAYYANLQAYANADGTLPASDLLVAQGGASHNYNEKWDNEGMDGVAYYYADGKYYADRAKTVSVLNLKDVSALTPRYTAESNRALEAEISSLKSNEWTTVTFYIHTGDTAKNYRLELWSGSKASVTGDGTANAANSYVVFDYNNPGTAESNFTGLLEEYEDVSGLDTIKSVFSYYDTASYLRYDSTLDENDIGNLYDYTPSANTEGVAYLKYSNANVINLFADYQYAEKAVTASEAEDDSSDSSSSSDDDGTGTNVWLLASSLAIAGVLLLAIASIVIRKVLVNARKNNGASHTAKKK